MTDDLQRQMEQASLLPTKYNIIKHDEGEDSNTMTAYDKTREDEVDMENDFDRVWDAGVARLSFVAMAQSFKPESEEAEEIIDKVVAREDNIVKVNFGEKQ